MAEQPTTKSTKEKFILKWKHGISEESQKEMGAEPAVVAQKFMNLYKCFDVMSPEEQAAYNAELIKAPGGIIELLSKMISGREVIKYHDFLVKGDIKSKVADENERSLVEQVAEVVEEATIPVPKNFEPPPPPPTPPMDI